MHQLTWIDRVVVSPFPINPYFAPRGDVLAAPVQSVATNVNTEDLYGGRASLLFKPNENLSVTPMALFQRMEMRGNDLVDSPPGPQYLAHYQPFPGSANNTSFQFNIPALIRYSVNQPRTFGTQINYSF